MKILKRLEIFDEFEELAKIIVNKSMPETPKGNKSSFFHFSKKFNQSVKNYHKNNFVQSLRKKVLISKSAN